MLKYTLVKHFIIRELTLDGLTRVVQDYNKFQNRYEHILDGEYNSIEQAENAILNYSIINRTELFNLVILPAYYCQDNR
jgi:hypothetical protein